MKTHTTTTANGYLLLFVETENSIRCYRFKGAGNGFELIRRVEK